MIVKRNRMEESFEEGAHWRYRRYGDIHGDANLPRTVAPRLLHRAQGVGRQFRLQVPKQVFVRVIKQHTIVFCNHEMQRIIRCRNVVSVLGFWGCGECGDSCEYN